MTQWPLMTFELRKMTIFNLFIRLGYGLYPKYLKELLGKKAKRDLKKGEPLYLGF